MVMPIGGFRNPAPDSRKGVHPGFGVSTAPLMSSEGFGQLAGSGLISEYDLWLDFGVTQESGGLKEYRLRLTLLSEIPVSSDDKYPSFWIPGLGVESKLLNDSGSSALVLGGNIWMFFLNKCDEGCDQNDYSVFLFPYAGIWIEGLFAFGEVGEPRLVLSIRLAPAVVAVLGGHVSAGVGGDLPLGGGISLRPEISAQCMLFYTYVGDDGLDYAGYTCGVSGGIAAQF